MTKTNHLSLESWFNVFRKNIIGIDQEIVSPDGSPRKILYADWTASGRSYLPIEETFIRDILPFVANTHTDTNTTGRGLTYAYHKAQHIIKAHVNASSEDVLISQYSGMTGLINKFQRILGLRIHEQLKDAVKVEPKDRPVVFVSHMEHHSNQTSWLETIADVVVVDPGNEGLVDLETFEQTLKKYEDRKLKIAAITACSNVTGIFTPYHEIAKLIHKFGGYCFVDFACCAPYTEINMHPEDFHARLDAIYFSPHKFLGGPGSAGVLIFHQSLYRNSVPDSVGGGTVEWTNPWGGRRYYESIEVREDGGTPAFLQTIRTALCIRLKEQMGVENILNREKEQLSFLFEQLEGVPNLHLLAGKHKHRLGILSFYIDDLHYNVGVKILNDRFGIQTRGGCSCAGTYGHYLLNVDPTLSRTITDKIDAGNYEDKPGWIRASIHPTTTNEELKLLAHGIRELAMHHKEWSKDYHIDAVSHIVSYNDPEKDRFIVDHFEKVMGA